MKYFFSYLLGAILIASCSINTKEENLNHSATKTSKVSLVLVGHHQIQIDHSEIIEISQLAKQLKKKNLRRKALVSVIMQKGTPQDDMLDVQDALRKANILRINYSTAKS